MRMLRAAAALVLYSLLTAAVVGVEVRRIGFVFERSWETALAMSVAKVAMRRLNRGGDFLPPSDKGVVKIDATFQANGLAEVVEFLPEVGLAGCDTSDATRIVASYASVVDTPLISPTSIGAELTDKKSMDSLFRLPRSDRLSHRMLGQVATHFGWKTLCFLTHNDAYAADRAVDLFDRLLEFGVDMFAIGIYAVDEEGADRDSVRSALQKLDLDGCRVLVFGGYVDHLDSVLSEAHALGLYDGKVWISITSGLLLWQKQQQQGTTPKDSNHTSGDFHGVFAIEEDPETTASFNSSGEASADERAFQRDINRNFSATYRAETEDCDPSSLTEDALFSFGVDDAIYDLSRVLVCDGDLDCICGQEEDAVDLIPTDTSQTAKTARLFNDLVWIYGDALRRRLLSSDDSTTMTAKTTTTAKTTKTSKTPPLREALLGTDWTGLESRHRFDAETQDAVHGMALYNFYRADDDDDSSLLASQMALRVTDPAARFWNLTVVTSKADLHWTPGTVLRPDVPYDGREVSASASRFAGGTALRLHGEAGKYYEEIDLRDYFLSTDDGVAYGTTFRVSLYKNDDEEMTTRDGHEDDVVFRELLAVNPRARLIHIHYDVPRAGKYQLEVMDNFTGELVEDSLVNVELSCDVGLGWIDAEGVCDACPAGFEGIDSECTPCSPGTFRSSQGATTLFCIPCPENGFASKNGSTACTRCPTNSRRDDDARTLYFYDQGVFDVALGVSVEECICPRGYYTTGGPREDAKTDGRLWGATGFACRPCPADATCNGTTYPPQTKKDFWADRHHRGSNRRVVECNAGHCAASYECKLGYQAHSRLCAVLRPSEYFQLGGLRPTPCLFRNHAGLRVVVYSVVLAMVFAFWLWYNLKVAPRHTSAALFNNGLQMMALVSLFVGVNFPSNNVFGFLQILYNFALFDADILTPSCVVRWSPIHSLYASVFVECFSLVFFAPAVAALLWRSLFDRDFVRDNERLFRRIALVERSVSSPAVVSSMGDHQMTTNNWCLTGRESSRLLLHKEQHEKNVQGLPATLEGPAGLLWAVDTSAPHTGGGPGFMTLERYGRHLSAGAASNDSASDSSPNKQQRKSGDAAAAVQKQQKPDFPKAKWWWLVVGWPRAIRAACHFYVGELGLEAAQACASALILVEANYANVSVKFMLALSCRDGHMHLDPTIRCASRKRRAIFIFALLGVFALVGFLVVLYVVMRRAYRRVQGLHEPHLLARLGWLYSEFKSPYHHLAILPLLEILVMCLVAAVSAPGNIEVVIAGVSFLITSSFALKCYMRPLEKDRDNLLGAASSFTVATYVYAAGFARKNGEQAVIWSVVVLGALLGFMAVAAWIYFLERLEAESRFKIRRRLFDRLNLEPRNRLRSLFSLTIHRKTSPDDDSTSTSSDDLFLAASQHVARRLQATWETVREKTAYWAARQKKGELPTARRARLALLRLPRRLSRLPGRAKRLVSGEKKAIYKSQRWSREARDLKEANTWLVGVTTPAGASSEDVPSFTASTSHIPGLDDDRPSQQQRDTGDDDDDFGGGGGGYGGEEEQKQDQGEEENKSKEDTRTADVESPPPFTPGQDDEGSRHVVRRAIETMIFALSGIVLRLTKAIFPAEEHAVSPERKAEDDDVLRCVALGLEANIQDASPLSQYSALFKASFWRSLARNYPGIISFAANRLALHERKIVFAVLVKLERFLENSAPHERALDYVVEEHARSALLYSLMSAQNHRDAEMIAAILRSPLKLLVDARTSLSRLERAMLPAPIIDYFQTKGKGGDTTIHERTRKAPRPVSYGGILNFRHQKGSNSPPGSQTGHSPTSHSTQKHHDEVELDALHYLDRHEQKLRRNPGVATLNSPPPSTAASPGGGAEDNKTHDDDDDDDDDSCNRRVAL